MNRREAIRRTAWLMGGIVSAPAIAGVLKGCVAKPTIGWKPVFFTEEQGAIVSRVSDIIIPRTDTPGAVDVGVPSFIDLMLKDVYKKEDQDRFLSGLQEFDDEAHKIYNDSFLDLVPDEQQELVKRVHDEAVKADGQGRPRPFILMVKELTMLGFFTSEVGATQVLQYDPVPGAYHGCLPLSEAGNGKTWAM